MKEAQICTSLDDLTDGIAISELLVFYHPELINLDGYKFDDFSIC